MTLEGFRKSHLPPTFTGISPLGKSSKTQVRCPWLGLGIWKFSFPGGYVFTKDESPAPNGSRPSTDTNQLVKKVDMGVSKNRGTPKSSISIGFSLINHPFWGTTIFGNTHINKKKQKKNLKNQRLGPWQFAMKKTCFKDGEHVTLSTGFGNRNGLTVRSGSKQQMNKKTQSNPKISPQRFILSNRSDFEIENVIFFRMYPPHEAGNFVDVMYFRDQQKTGENPDWLSQWPTFKLLGVSYLIGKRSRLNFYFMVWNGWVSWGFSHLESSCSVVDLGCLGFFLPLQSASCWAGIHWRNTCQELPNMGLVRDSLLKV